MTLVDKFEETEFDFSIEVQETKWLVDRLIPYGHLCFMLAQAGVGKSLIAEFLGACMVHSQPFAGMDTMDGDVLLVDQDSPSNVLHKRLKNFATGLHSIKKHKLFLESMKGYSLYDNSLMSIIHSYPTAKLVIIDSMHSVCGKLDPNSTTDMSRWAKIKNECLTKENTILVLHHITQHSDFTVEQLMGGNANGLAMGNSAIIQQADSYYIVGASAKNGRTEKLYIRSVSKRVSIPQKPIVLSVINPECGGEIMAFDGNYAPEMDECQVDIMTLFSEQNQIERTVKEVYETMGHKHGEKNVRESLNELAKNGKLIMSRNRANLFKYKLA